MFKLLIRPGSLGVRPIPLRSFHSFPLIQLVYNSKKPINEKPQPPVKSSTEPETAVKLTSSFQDQVKVAQTKLLTNKYYKATPNFLKPYIAGFLTRPVGFGISFFILHEITAIIPLLGLWYFFIKFNWIPIDLPTEFILKGTQLITDKLISVPDSKLIYDKATIIIAGANAYAATKLLLPVRLPISVLLTPWFDRSIVQRIKRLFSRKKN